MNMDNDGMILTGKNRKTLRETCPSDILPQIFSSAILSTTNSTWSDMVTNPGLCGERLETNHLSYGMAFRVVNAAVDK
jgi:hypothetical protein